jgi:IclR family KDG regulon transcriptional repressor
MFLITKYISYCETLSFQTTRRLPVAQLIQVLQRAMRVLSSFDHGHPEMGVAQLARKLDLPKPTVYRILATLESGGFIQQNPDTGKYHLGFQAAVLGLLALQQVSMRSEALPFLQRLLDECQETVDLAVFDAGEMVYLEVLESPQPVKIAAKAGRRLPAYCTASGKAYLAYASEEDVAMVLAQEMEAYTSNTIVDRERFMEDLHLTRERGYAISGEEFEEGIKAVAASVMDSSKQVVAVIAIAGPAYRLPPERVAELGEAAKRTAQELSHRLGARST